MDSYLSTQHCDLVTPDGRIIELQSKDPKTKLATILIEHISPLFVGYHLEAPLVFFNLKSTLAQLGLNAITKEYERDTSHDAIRVKVELVALSDVSRAMLGLLEVGAYIGKLFAADPKRKVCDPDYLMRMFGRSDHKGRPLLSLGGLEGSGDLILEKIDGRTVAFLSLKDGIISYNNNVYSFLPTLARALTKKLPNTRNWLHLHQYWEAGKARLVQHGEVLLVRTAPLHIRTVYGRVVDSLLPQGYHHTTASVLEPDTHASGDIYELYGSSHQALDDMPLEFYTLEPHREHIFFSDRDQLLSDLEDPKNLFEAFKTAPEPKNHLAAVFIVKGTQMKELKAKDWIIRAPYKHDFPGLSHPARQALVVEKYIEHQPQYPFLQSLENGLITSQGILLNRHLPTPLLKRMLLSENVSRYLKRIYFQYPSSSSGDFFSQEDRAMLVDLAKFAIPTFWVDEGSEHILQYVLRPEKDAGMFVPLNLVEAFRKAIVFGVYGSNLLEGSFEQELFKLLEGVLKLRSLVNHPLLCKDTPLALVTGGGPGAMEVGNRVAKKVGIISCANIVDFRMKKDSVVHEQTQNRFIDAKMTYRLDRLVERQSEFFLDIPIFLPGGIGMDFELLLEEVRRKTGAAPANPVLLFGEVEYWERKITSRFKLNRETGTIKESEWVSNCFFCIQTAEQGLAILQKFFKGQLEIGKNGPIYDQGFVSVRIHN